jgi:hypothetical protein
VAGILTASCALLLLCSPPTSRPAKPSLLERECERKAAELRALRLDGLRVMSAPTFVIAGDLPPARLQSLAARTITPAAERLGRMFDLRPPISPICVFVFDGQESYRRFAKSCWGDTDVPYFGYFNPAENAVIMDINTGTGTLVHELTHALTAPDFPDMPAWFNEGLASLYEQCRFDGDEMIGLVNWRLPTLQAALQDGSLPSLERMVVGNDFRGRHEGLNYAQARYLCMFMQERGRLKRFYKLFRENRQSDPTGLHALQDAFDGRSTGEIERAFREWVPELNTDSPGR